MDTPEDGAESSSTQPGSEEKAVKRKRPVEDEVCAACLARPQENAPPNGTVAG